MKLTALSSFAILLGLAGGFAARTLSAQPRNPTPQIAAQSQNRQTSPIVTDLLIPQTSSFGDPNLSPDATRKAELYLFLHQATSEELITHWKSLTSSPDVFEWSLIDFVTLWHERDPKTALRHLSESRFQNLYWWLVGRTDHSQAIDQISKSNLQTRATIIAAIGASDPDLAIPLLENSLGSQKERALAGIMEGLFQRDPQEALAFALKHQSHHTYQLGEFLQKWAAQSPEEAFQWALKQPSLKSSDLAGLAPILLNHDAGRFAEKFQSLPAGRAKTKLLAAQAAHLSRSDPDSALELAGQQRGPLRKEMLDQIGKTLAHDHPDKAREALLKLIGEQSSPSFTITSPEGSVELQDASIWYTDWAKTLALSDPEGLLNEAITIKTELSDLASAQVIDLWLDTDLASAREWLKNLPNNGEHDTLIGDATDTLTAFNLEDAPSHLRLIEKIQEPKLRQETLNHLFNIWSGEGSESLEAYRKTHRMTAEQKKAYDQRSYN